MKESKELKVSAIKIGTVIDHIPADSLFAVISILKLEKLSTQITFGTNLESKRLGKKAIIKLADVHFADDEINKIALIAPEAKLNIIEDYMVIEKKLVTVPDHIFGIVKCVNPKCITNHEQIVTKFEVIDKASIALRCEYCEKITDRNHINLVE